MKVFIPSTGVPERLHTHKLWPLNKLTIVVHTSEQADSYQKTTGVKHSQIIVTQNPKGIGLQRDFILRNLVRPGEWFTTCDDNIRDWLDINGHTMKVEDAYYMMEEDMRLAEKTGAHLIGFATTSNPMYRRNLHRNVGFVLGKMMIEQKADINRDIKLEAKEDYGWTAAHLLRFGRVLIDSRIYNNGKHYEKGGVGTWDERLPRNIADSEYLMQKYPGLFRYKKKVGKHPKSEIQIRFHSTEQVEGWRLLMRKLRSAHAVEATRP